jgi:hypothetical protein
LLLGGNGEWCDAAKNLDGGMVAQLVLLLGEAVVVPEDLQEKGQGMMIDHRRRR